MNTIKKKVFSFSSLTLHAVNFLVWNKIITVSWLTTLRVFLMGRSGCPTQQGNCGGVDGGRRGLPAILKVQTFPFYWIKISHIGKLHILQKKVPRIVFRQVLTNALPAACIQLHNSDLFGKSQSKLKSLNTKYCLAGLSPRIILQVSPFLPKVSKNWCTHQVWTVSPSPEPLLEILGMGKNPLKQPKMYSFLPSETFPLIDPAKV